MLMCIVNTLKHISRKLSCIVFPWAQGSLQSSFSEMTTVVNAEDLPPKPVVAVL